MGTEDHRPSGYNLAEVLFVLVFATLLSGRFISLPILFAATVLAHRAGRHSRRAVVVRWLFFVSLLSPVDINLAGMYKDGGAHRSGPRLVRAVVGMPRHTELISRYGEYYWLGCSGGPLNPPRWMVVIF